MTMVLGLMAQLVGRWLILFSLSTAVLWVTKAYQSFGFTMNGAVFSEILKWPQAGPAGLFHRIVCGTHWFVYSTTFLSMLALYAVIVVGLRIFLLVSCGRISHWEDWDHDVVESSRRFDLLHLSTKGSFRAYILHWLGSPSWEHLQSWQSERIIRLSSIMMSVIAIYAILIAYIYRIADSLPLGGMQSFFVMAKSFLIMPVSFRIIFADGAFLLCAAWIYRRAHLHGYVQGSSDGDHGWWEIREGIWRTLCNALLFVAGMLGISVAVRLFCTVMLTGQPC
ncbi:hypothetical protein [Azospirillum sp. TSH100]|uniref:hypothetical protein n=1 Tax=Azospirillum sp. TSH100 TaxID=652764 RepID=UPI0010A9D596|nr:hypothetical protein [Azospirillum sp. TSH100]QCG89038.1 hypothetical protein E6C72_14545 [Azospirillum sp. TSH100]